METDRENAMTSIFLIVIALLLCLVAYSQWKLKERVEDIEQRQYEVNEYILNRIGG